MDKNSLSQGAASQQTTSQPESKRRLFLRLFLGIFSGLVIISLVLFVLSAFHVIALPSLQLPHNLLTTHKSPEQAVLTVGEETIYQKDLDTELSYYPPQQNIDRTKLLMQKLVRDSITLQAAKAEGLVQLDQSVFNSLQKDYTKRLALVQDVKRTIDTKRETLSGTVISLWFYNGSPGKIGYQAGKDYTRKKITLLHDAVATKKMTVQQAVEEIRNDPKLQDIDLAYKANAGYSFAAGPQDKIVFDDTFNQKIRALPAGGVSQVYLAQDKSKDAVYMFAVVSQRKGDKKPSYDAWLKQKEVNYAVKDL